MSEERLTEGVETGTVNRDASFDDYMHKAGEPRDKQGKAKVWRSEENAFQGSQEEGMFLSILPDACICLIVSYLSPRDVARGACACVGFRNTLDSDSVWDLFVPKSAVKAVGLNDELQAATKKKIFTVLCKPFLLRENLAYWLDQDTGGVCYSMAVNGLRVVWGDDNRYWKRFSRLGARWPEVAYLYQVCWFHVSGNIKCELPPGAYTLSWRIQYETGSSGVLGWDVVPTEFSVSTTDGSRKATSHRYLADTAIQQTQLGDLTPVRLVEDSWFEFDAGEVIVEDGEKVTSLDFSMMETESGGWKQGVILDGIMLRPSSLTRVIGRYLSVEELGEISRQREQEPPVEPHPVGLPDPRGVGGLRGPNRGVFPRRRGGIRLVHPPPPPPFDVGEN